MSDVTHILAALSQGDPQAASQLWPLVYDALRQLAAQKMAQEKRGQTLQATALVHEAYLRLLGASEGQPWSHRGHFFAAAAEAMRRIVTTWVVVNLARVYELQGRYAEAAPLIDELLATDAAGGSAHRVLGLERRGRALTRRRSGGRSWRRPSCP